MIYWPFDPLHNMATLNFTSFKTLMHNYSHVTLGNELSSKEAIWQMNVCISYQMMIPTSYSLSH